MVKSNLWSVERILKEDECKRFCTKGILHYPLMSILLFNLCFCLFFLSFSFFFLNNLLTYVDYPTFFKLTKFVLSLSSYLFYLLYTSLLLLGSNNDKFNSAILAIYFFVASCHFSSMEYSLNKHVSEIDVTFGQKTFFLAKDINSI